MKALIDGDILVYQAAFGGEKKKEDDTVEVFNFEYVAALLNSAIDEICLAVKADDYILYLTGDTNFRNDIAVTKPYKGNRKKPKPFHYKNARAYLLGLPQTQMIEGIEADDAMSIAQMKDISKSLGYYWPPSAENELHTVICTRDKDLRMIPGWHYGWEHGNQPEFGMQFVDEFGTLDYNAEKNKLTGTGILFFYSQLITGDNVDNISGLPRKGPKAAFDVLGNATTEGEAFEAVRELYKDVMEDKWEEFMLEQGRLLWMVRETVDGQPVMWEIPDV